MDSRFKQAHKEARWSLLLAVCWLIVWSVSAWTGGTTPGIFGFPRWFELSCLFAPLFFLFLCTLMIRFIFHDIPLEDQGEQ